MSYLPSVVAAATMLHVVNTVEPCLLVEYQSQLLGILGVDQVRRRKKNQSFQSLNKQAKLGYVIDLNYKIYIAGQDRWVLQADIGIGVRRAGQ